MKSITCAPYHDDMRYSGGLGEGSWDLVTWPIARSKAGILVDAMFHLNLFSC